MKNLKLQTLSQLACALSLLSACNEQMKPSLEPKGARAYGDFKSSAAAPADADLKLPFTDTPENLRFSPDSRTLLTSFRDGTVQISELETSQSRLLYQQAVANSEDWIHSIGFSPDGRQSVIASRNTTALVEIATGETKLLISQENFRTYGVNFSPDGQSLIAMGGPEFYAETTIGKLFNFSTGATFSLTFPQHSFAKRAAFSRDSRLLLVTSNLDLGKLYDAKSGQDLASFAGDEAQFSPDGRYFAASGKQDFLQIYTTQGQPFRKVDHEQHPIWNFAFSPDSQQVVTTTERNSVRLTDLRDGASKTFLHDGRVNGAEFSSDGKILATASDDGTVKLINLADGSERLLAHPDRVSLARFSPSGNFLFTYVFTNSANAPVRELRIFDLRSNSVKIISGLESESTAYDDASFSPDERYFAFPVEKSVVIFKL